MLQHVLQAFAGPGGRRSASRPTYSMYPLLTRGTGATWIAGTRAHDYTVDAERRGIPGRATPRRTSSSSARRTTRPARRWRSTSIEAVYEATDGIVIVDEAYQEFAPHDERVGADAAART